MRVARVVSISASAIIFCTAAFLSLRSQAQSTPQAIPAPKLAEQQFKNIQVLKGIPADQLIPSMQFISASLGVECEYCHVERANDKDDKKSKLVARKMITMMQAVNKDNFEGHREVTCYSCHRGAANPIATPVIAPPIATEDAAPRSEARSAPTEEKPALPAADQLLDKYLAAVGGADALHKITSRIEKGNLVVPGGQPAPIDVYARAPDKRVSVNHMKTGDSITAFNGQQGWLSIPTRTHIMSAAESDAARIDADFYFAANLKTLYQKFSVAPGEKIDTHDTWLVTARSEGKPPLRLYLDKDSGLLLRLIRYAETPLGRNPTQIDYADYRPADGIKLPFRWTLARPGGNRFTIQIDHLEQNVPIDSAKFTPPPPQPSPAPPASH